MSEQSFVKVKREGKFFEIPTEIGQKAVHVQNLTAIFGDVKWVKNAVRKTFAAAHEHSKKAAERQKRNYDKSVSPNDDFQVHDWVWYFYPPRARQKLGQG